MEDFGEMVNLVVFDQSDYQVIIIDQVQCIQLMWMLVLIGGKLLMYVFGVGKVFFVQLSEEQVISLLYCKGLYVYMYVMLVFLLYLKEDLVQICKWGYFFDDEEYVFGLCCVVVCIYDEYCELFVVIFILGFILCMIDDWVIELGVLVIKVVKEVMLVYGGVK